MRTGNPTLGDDTFSPTHGGEATMTLRGTVTKTLFLLAVLLAGFAYTWTKATEGYTEEFAKVRSSPQLDENGEELPLAIAIPKNVYWYAVAGCLGGFLVAMIIIFYQKSAPLLSPIYAVLEGCALGAISAGMEAKYPGIAFQAAVITFGTLFSLLAVYATGIVRASENFRAGLLAAMGGILIVYLVNLGMQMFGAGYLSIVEGSGTMSILFSGFVVVIAALNLVLDFDYIEGSVGRCPRYMEWYAGFGLIVSLVWLYLEVLRLAAKLRSGSTD